MPHCNEFSRILEDGKPVQSLLRASHAVSQRNFADKDVFGPLIGMNGILAVALMTVAWFFDNYLKKNNLYRYARAKNFQ